MITTPEIVDIGTKQMARIHLAIPRGDIGKVMSAGIAEVMAAAEDQGIGPTGAWFTHHLNTDSSVFDFEICVPVSAPVGPVGRVVAGEWPAMKAARSVLHGDYDGLDAAWREFYGWIKTNGHSAAKDMYQVYVAGPEGDRQPADFRTELIIPLL